MNIRMLLNAIYKLIFFPAVLFLFSYLLPGILAFSGVWHVITVSLLLLFIGVIADELVLPIFGLSRSTMQGTVAIIFIIYLSGVIFPNSFITITGAIFAGVGIGIVEVIAHTFVRADQKGRI
ncbi:DUF2512 family protein [Aneurinibacillus terranovensis]|uniref:DUF2512 family protein n=1 Tax=Aneurinibacillus terranovensis TaxID=278991 RepID=UPI000403D39E|nr:DUF2512 family protein [Aneurinibacillus terranovensis]